MKYREFFSSLKRSETSHVRALFIKDCCAVQPIPFCFTLLLAEIIHLMERKHAEFCQAGEITAVFGLQVAPGHIESDLPKALHRIYERQHPSSHFCGVLSYLILPDDADLRGIKTWKSHQSLIVDFTTGEVMDDDRYLSLSLRTSASGKLYGKLPADVLETAWRLV